MPPRGLASPELESATMPYLRADSSAHAARSLELLPEAYKLPSVAKQVSKTVDCPRYARGTYSMNKAKSTACPEHSVECTRGNQLHGEVTLPDFHPVQTLQHSSFKQFQNMLH